MYFVSTKNKNQRVTLSQALLQGLSPEGGLYVPETLPKIALDSFEITASYPEFCRQVLTPFFQGDPLSEKLEFLCEQSFNFPVKLQSLGRNLMVMELFHGPTLSFKDFGARFLANCLTELATDHPLTLMVATSGDTGSAVAGAFYHKPNITVVVLFPKDGVSQRQQAQITCWGDNVYAIAVKGTFDDCQRLVKESFKDNVWQQDSCVCTANSINLGRLLPQICYYAYTSLQLFRAQKIKPGFIVPSGNLGNVTAAYYAKKMGFPISQLIIATNENRAVSRYLESGHYEPLPSVSTLANAMDVGAPSNFERLCYLFKDFDTFSQEITAYSVTDAQIKQTIFETYQQNKYVLCPHTATAKFVHDHYAGSNLWVIAATADPSKFETVIEPIIKQSIPVPERLANLLKRASPVGEIEPSMDALTALLRTN